MADDVVGPAAGRNAAMVQLRSRRSIAGPLASHDETSIALALRALKAGGTRVPTAAEVEAAMPDVVQVDASALSNPYATGEVVRRLREIGADELERMLSDRCATGAAVASAVASHVGIPENHLLVAGGAGEIVRALVSREPGPLLVSVPTISAWLELAAGPVIAHRLDPRQGFRLDLEALEDEADRHWPETVVIVTPNSPDGGLAARDDVIGFVERVRGRVGQVIVDERFGHFLREGGPSSLAPLVAEHPHLVVVDSLSRSHGIAGLGLAYAAMSPLRAWAARDAAPARPTAFTEWFCGLLGDAGYLRAHESARLRYARDACRLFAGLAALPGVKLYPSAANFALLELDRPAHEVATALLARHGVFVRECAGSIGLDGDRFLRVAARSEPENGRILDALGEVLGRRAQPPVPAAA